MVNSNDKISQPPRQSVSTSEKNTRPHRASWDYISNSSDFGDIMSPAATRAICDVLVSRIELNQRVSTALRVLSDEGLWSEAIKLVVQYGGVSQAEISRSVGVMRSTVARWYNSEVEPQPFLYKKYGRMISQAVTSKSNEVRFMILNNYSIGSVANAEWLHRRNIKNINMINDDIKRVGYISSGNKLNSEGDNIND